METTSDPVAAARRVASFGLPGTLPNSEIRLAIDSWPMFLDLLSMEHLTGLALAAAREGVLEVGRPYDRDLRSRQRDAMVWALTLERSLLRVVDVLERAGIKPLVLKGPAVARSVYPDPSWRPFRDLDLLVKTSDWRLACGVLGGLGFRRCLPEPRAGFDERFAKAATFQDAAGVQVDLHRTLAEGAYGVWMDADALIERTALLPIGDREILRLDDAALALHAFIHASLGSMPPRLLALRDVLQISTSTTVDWSLVAKDARQWRLGSVIRHAWTTATRTLVPLEPPPILDGLSPSRREHRVLSLYTTERRRHGGVALGTIAAVRGITTKARFVRALLLPSRRFLVARTGSPRASAYLGRWSIPVRWLGRAVFPAARLSGRANRGSKRSSSRAETTSAHAPSEFGAHD